MPLTLLSHQAVVLPFKIRAPHLTSGTALVLGSMAPDIEYLLRGYPTGTVGHTWAGVFTFCLPVTLVLFWIVTRIIAEPVAAHLPHGGEFRLRAYGAIRDQPTDVRHWAIVTVSALIGAASHVVLDKLSGGWSSRAPTHFESWIPFDTLPSDEAWIVAKLASWVILAVASVLMMRHIGRRELIARWSAERAARHTSGARAGRATRGSVPGPIASSVSTLRYWSWVAVAGVAGGALGALYRRSGFFMHQPATWVHIGLCAVSGTFVGLVLASVAWHAARSRSAQLRGSQQ